MIFRTILLTLTLTLPLFSQGQSFYEDKLEQYFESLSKYNKAMGSISIFQDGQEVYQKSIGFIDLHEELAANKNTKYRIGSITKSFTAVIILKLIEDGKLKLEDKLSSYYPTVKGANKITIEHLLRHRSGIFNFTNDPSYISFMEGPMSRKKIVEKISEYEIVFTPGKKAEYSNSNYLLLSLIAEEVTTQSFSEILKTYITKPLDLQNTYYGGAISHENNEAQSYTYTGQWEKSTETDMSIPMGAGAIVSTPTDINKFYYSLFEGKLLNKKSLEKMTTLKENFGMGIFSFPFHNKSAFGHNGGIDGFRSMAGYFPKENLTISYTGNGVVTSVNDIMLAALSIYFNKDFELPDFANEYKPIESDLLNYEGLYATESMLLRITITVNGSNVTAQATGQSSFLLEPVSQHLFKFDPAGLKIEFKPQENAFILNQGGGKFKFVKVDR